MPDMPQRSLRASGVHVTTIYEAMSAVMAKVGAVKKTGHNSQSNYNFRGIDAVPPKPVTPPAKPVGPGRSPGQHWATLTPLAYC